jgi:hypothetical protein
VLGTIGLPTMNERSVRLTCIKSRRGPPGRERPSAWPLWSPAASSGRAATSSFGSAWPRPFCSRVHSRRRSGLTGPRLGRSRGSLDCRGHRGVRHVGLSDPTPGDESARRKS